eukprot:PhM_4_TR2087/c4_g1_i1/m.91402
MAMVDAEWESLTAVQQKARATEFAKRRQRAKWTKTDIGLLLKRAPAELKTDKIWPTLVDLANRLEREDKEACDEADCQQLFAGANPGELIDSRIISAIIEHAPAHAEWTIIPPMELLEMVRGTRRAVVLNSNVAAVIYSRGHFTLAIKRSSLDQVEWYDSLAGPKPSPPSMDVAEIISGFRRLLDRQGIRSSGTLPRACTLQKLNDCGVEVIRNIGLQIFGDTNMTRDVIARARDAPEPKKKPAEPPPHIVDPEPPPPET